MRKPLVAGTCAALLSACGSGSTPPDASTSNQPARGACEGDVPSCIARCDAGHAESCADLGAMYAQGVTPDPQRAAQLFQRACELGEASSCIIVGSWYASGEHVAQDATRAAQLFERACKAGEASGCALLGLAYAGGTGVPRDVARATELLRHACDASIADACTALKELSRPR